MKAEIKQNFEHRLLTFICDNSDSDVVFDVELEYVDDDTYTFIGDFHVQGTANRWMDYDSPPEGGRVFVACNSCTIITYDKNNIAHYHDEDAEEIVKNVIFRISKL